MAIIHVKVIDATGKPAMSKMTVIINGDRISEIGKNDQFRVGDRVIPTSALRSRFTEPQAARY